MDIYRAENSRSSSVEILNNINLKTSVNDRNGKRANDRKRVLSEDSFPVRSLLSNSLLFTQTETDFARLARHLQTVSFKAGDIIYQPNSISEYTYFPETAVFSQLNILEDGRTVETAMVGSEGIIGLSSVLGFQTTNFWTQTSVAGKAFKICSEVFKQEFISGGLMQQSFLEYLSSYITQISQRSVCNNHHRVEERFSTWLLLLDDRCHQQSLALTHEQIAQFLGVHRPSITFIAQELRDNGIIDYLRGRIFIRNRKKLELSACECYSTIR